MGAPPISRPSATAVRQGDEVVCWTPDGPECRGCDSGPGTDLHLEGRGGGLASAWRVCWTPGLVSRNRTAVRWSMALSLGSVVINCCDLDLMTTFWSEALSLRPGP